MPEIPNIFPSARWKQETPNNLLWVVGFPRTMIRQSEPDFNQRLYDYLLLNTIEGGWRQVRGSKIWFHMPLDAISMARLSWIYDNGGQVRRIRFIGAGGQYEVDDVFVAYLRLAWSLRTNNTPLYLTGSSYEDEQGNTVRRTWAEWGDSNLATRRLEASRPPDDVIFPLSFQGTPIPGSEIVQLIDTASGISGADVLSLSEAQALLVPGGDYIEEEVI